MNNMDDVLAVMGQLAADDRSWLLKNLPRHVRTRLIERLETADNTADSTGEGFAMARRAVTLEVPREMRIALAGASAADVAACLKSEPAWVIALLISSHAWPWREQVLQQLSSKQRFDIAESVRQPLALTPRAMTVILRTLARELELSHTEEPATGLQALLMKARKVVGRRAITRWRTV
jgi:hypothetical protein